MDNQIEASSVQKSTEVDLTAFLRVRDEQFQQLMSLRGNIRDDYAHKIKALEKERDAKLQENYSMLIQLGLPEDLMPLPLENEEQKQKRIEVGKPRKLTETEIRRVLREMMEKGKSYTALQLIACLQISYKDFSQFYQNNNPSFLEGVGLFKKRVYRLASK